MKPILHFMPVCSVDLYQSLLDLVSVEVGFVPDYGWASESHLAHVMISLFSSCRSLYEQSLYFFVQKWQPHTHTIPWPSGHAIRHFLRLCHICFVIFVFCCMFMSYSDHYHIGRRHFHKGGPHYAKKKQIKSCSCKWERCWVQNVNHEILGASLCGNHNRCPFLLLLCIFGRLPKKSDWLSEVSHCKQTPGSLTRSDCLSWVMSGSFAAAQTMLK